MRGPLRVAAAVAVGAGAAVAAAAAATAISAASPTPVPRSAQIAVTSQPSFSPSLSSRTLLPFFSIISIMFTAMTTGIPSSVNCVDRYRFRSMFVPSTRFKITSGRSPIR